MAGNSHLIVFFFPLTNEHTTCVEGNVYIFVFLNFPEIATWKEHRLTRRKRFVLRKEVFSKSQIAKLKTP
jgi:hypothetical protein